MGMTPVGLQLIASLYKHGVLADRQSVLELGAEDSVPGQGDMAECLERLVGVPRDPETIIDAELFYKSLGFTRYQCIDAEGHRHHALAFDLNKDIAQEYGFVDRFDLVANFGTTGHVFDQCRVFQNIHSVCAPNGIMIHEVPFQKRLNHGFYNYHPTFFYDLAGANHYDLLGIYLGLPGDLMPYSDDVAKLLSRTNTETELLAVLRRTTEERFHHPYNGKYLKSSLLKEGYGLQYTGGGTAPQRIARMPPLSPTSDVNLMPTGRIAKTLLSRVVRKVLGA
jgi:SAM-dependent methyltransferase